MSCHVILNMSCTLCVISYLLFPLCGLLSIVPSLWSLIYCFLSVVSYLLFPVCDAVTMCPGHCYIRRPYTDRYHVPLVLHGPIIHQPLIHPSIHALAYHVPLVLHGPIIHQPLIHPSIHTCTSMTGR